MTQENIDTVNAMKAQHIARILAKLDHAVLECQCQPELWWGGREVLNGIQESMAYYRRATAAAMNISDQDIEAVYEELFPVITEETEAPGPPIEEPVEPTQPETEAEPDPETPTEPV